MYDVPDFKKYMLHILITKRRVLEKQAGLGSSSAVQVQFNCLPSIYELRYLKEDLAPKLRLIAENRGSKGELEQSKIL